MTRTMTRDHYAKHGPKSSHVRCSLKGLTVRRERVFRVIPSSIAYPKFVLRIPRPLQRHTGESRYPETFKIPGFRVAQPRTVIRGCPE